MLFLSQYFRANFFLQGPILKIYQHFYISDTCFRPMRWIQPPTFDCSREYTKKEIENKESQPYQKRF